MGTKGSNATIFADCGRAPPFKDGIGQGALRDPRSGGLTAGVLTTVV